jgi:hypothetical protein
VFRRHFEYPSGHREAVKLNSDVKRWRNLYRWFRFRDTSRAATLDCTEGAIATGFGIRIVSWTSSKRHPTLLIMLCPRLPWKALSIPCTESALLSRRRLEAQVTADTLS